MFETKKRVRILWTTVCLSLVGTLALTLMVFAGSDTSEHDKSRSHRHRTSARSQAPYEDWIQWSVEVGRMYWDNTSTFVQHSIVVRNNSDEDIKGDWEFNHHVFKEHSPWLGNATDDDPIRNISAGGTWSKSGCTEVYFPSGNKKAGKYQITAYTRVTLFYKGTKEVTKPSGGQRKNQRDIKSEWFNVK